MSTARRSFMVRSRPRERMAPCLRPGSYDPRADHPRVTPGHLLPGPWSRSPPRLPAPIVVDAGDTSEERQSDPAACKKRCGRLLPTFPGGGAAPTRRLLSAGGEAGPGPAEHPELGHSLPCYGKTRRKRMTRRPAAPLRRRTGPEILFSPHPRRPPCPRRSRHQLSVAGPRHNGHAPYWQNPQVPSVEKHCLTSRIVAGPRAPAPKRRTIRVRAAPFAKRRRGGPSFPSLFTGTPRTDQTQVTFVLRRQYPRPRGAAPRPAVEGRPLRRHRAGCGLTPAPSGNGGPAQGGFKAKEAPPPTILPWGSSRTSAWKLTCPQGCVQPSTPSAEAPDRSLEGKSWA